jgi:hypothetical protein
MTKDAYWYVFLKSDQNYSGVIGDFDEYFYGKLSEKPFLKTYADFQNPADGWSKPSKTRLEESRNHAVVLLDENTVYSPAFRMTIPDSLKSRKNLYVKFKADYL